MMNLKSSRRTLVCKLCQPVVPVIVMRWHVPCAEVSVEGNIFSPKRWKEWWSINITTTVRGSSQNMTRYANNITNGNYSERTKALTLTSGWHRSMNASVAIQPQLLCLHRCMHLHASNGKARRRAEPHPNFVAGSQQLPLWMAVQAFRC
mmetsp:Transcript_6629/g.18002  ORF Transcript_6629/g.18002 Transcript_6629/m.18002 type:complete len:149 (-) Transcript_6629:1349-1795(-)